MSADRILALKLIGDVSSINKTMKGTQGRLKSFAMSAGSWVKAAGIGLAIEGVARLGDALGDAWTGFRDGEKAAAQLGQTWDNLNVSTGDLGKTIEEISALTLKLGTDDTEAIKAFNTALLNTGGKPREAMNRLRIAQDLVANGSAPNLESAMRLIQQAAKGSSRVVDRFGLTSETAGGRVKELGQKVKGAAARAAELDPLGVALNGVGEGLETVVGALSQGDLEGALSGIRDIGAAIAGFFETAGPKITETMDKLTGGAFSDFVETVKSFADDISPKFDAAVAAVGEAWAALQPHIENAVAFMQPLIDMFSSTIAGGLGFVLDAVTGALTTFKELLEGDVDGAIAAVSETLGNLGTDLETILGGIGEFLSGILPGIQDGARNIGDAIFDGIVDVLTGIGDELKRIFDEAVGNIRDAWNTLDFAIPAFDLKWDGVGVPNPLHGTVADVFGTPNIQVLPSGNFHVWEGTGDLIPDLAQGGIITKRPGGMLARIGEGSYDEAVIPLRPGMGMGGNTYNINVSVAPGGDLREAGRQIVRAIKEFERGDGKVWRTG